MTDKDFADALLNDLRKARTVWDVGRVTAITGSSITIKGLSRTCQIGDDLNLPARTPLKAEVTRIDPRDVVATVYGETSTIRIGQAVIPEEQPVIYPNDTWLGRVLDPFAQAMDGESLMRGKHPRLLYGKPPPSTLRKSLGKRMHTGIAALDTFLPLVTGQRVGLFAGSGVGKSTLLGQLAENIQADVIVIGLIGERGRELREFIEQTLGKTGLAKSVVIAATSDMAPSLRRRAAYTAMTVAEHFRDEGQSVLLLIDSLTRFAEAYREVATTAGETANLRGFPPSMTHALASLCERAGTGVEGMGDITAVFSVLVAGSDMEEPVSDILRGLLDGHYILDRKIAERGRYPALDILRSVSRALPQCATSEENELLQNARHLMAQYDEANMMIKAGLYEKGSDPKLDIAVQKIPAIDNFLAQSNFPTVEETYEALRQILTD